MIILDTNCVIGTRQRNACHRRCFHRQGSQILRLEAMHSLEPEDLAALTMEASAMAGVPLAGTNHTVGIEDYHKL